MEPNACLAIQTPHDTWLVPAQQGRGPVCVAKCPAVHHGTERLR